MEGSVCDMHEWKDKRSGHVEGGLMFLSCTGKAMHIMFGILILLAHGGLLQSTVFCTTCLIRKVNCDRVRNY